MNILNLEILTSDLDKTENFYHNILGFPITAKSDSSISFKAGSSELTFKFVADINPIYHIAFNIPNNKLYEALEWIKASVDILDAEPGSKIADFVNWNAKSFYFYDTNSNILEFIVRYDLHNESDTLFSGDSVICISEIGLAADSVSAECDALNKAYQIPVFSKQPLLSNFAAMGDNDGLLILSSVNRLWHLTKHPAQKHHTKLTIQHNKQTHSLTFYENKNGPSN